MIGGVLWLASPWAPRAGIGIAPATNAAPNGPVEPNSATDQGDSDMLRMARAAFLACGVPTPPTDVPDGTTATRDQMVAAHSAVKAFDAATTTYNQCVDTTAYQAAVQFKAVASGTDTETLNALQSRLHNEAIDRDQAVANRFNVQLRLFKARKNP